MVSRYSWAFFGVCARAALRRLTRRSLSAARISAPAATLARIVSYRYWFVWAERPSACRPRTPTSTATSAATDTAERILVLTPRSPHQEVRRADRAAALEWAVLGGPTSAMCGYSSNDPRERG